MSFSKRGVREILRCLSERDPEVWGSNGEGPVNPALMFGLGERV